MMQVEMDRRAGSRWLAVMLALGLILAWFPVAGVASAVGHDEAAYVPLLPERVFDTRTSTGGPVGKVGAGQTVSATVAGVG